MLARFTNGLPFLIDRKLGRGQVLLVCTGVSPQWNTLPLTNTMLVFDRILRGMFQDTLPQRNMDTQEQLVLPVAAADRHAQVTLVDSGGREEPLTVDVLGTDRYGVTVANRTQRGLYHVVATRRQESRRRKGKDPKLWDVLLAVNGPAQESELGIEEKAAAGQSDAPATLRDAAQAATATSAADAAGAGTVEVGPAGRAGMPLGGIGLVGLAFVAGGTEPGMNFTMCESSDRDCLRDLRRQHAIDRERRALAGRAWAHNSAGWLFFGCLALSILAVLFYFRYQRENTPRPAWCWPSFAPSALSLLLLALAEPILTIKVVQPDAAGPVAAVRRHRQHGHRRRSGREASGPRWPNAVGLRSPRRPADADDHKPARMEYVKSLLQNDERRTALAVGQEVPPAGVPVRSAQRRPHAGSRPPASRRRSTRKRLAVATDDRRQGDRPGRGPERPGAALRHDQSGRRGGLQRFPAELRPAGRRGRQAAGVPVHTVGVGPTATVDVAVELRAPLMMKKDERSVMTATVRQQGLDDREVTVRFSARRLGGADEDSTVEASAVLAGAKSR